MTKAMFIRRLALVSLPLLLSASLGLAQPVSARTATDLPASEAGRSEAIAPPAQFTLPPYVQPLSPRTVAILFQTPHPAYAWIEFGETPALGQKRDAALHGLRVANVTSHRIVIRGLQPDTTYYYRVAIKPIAKFEAYSVDFEPEQCTPVTSFRALPGPRQPVTTVIYNDLHSRAETLRRLRQVVGTQPYDFSLFNGDCIADPGTAEEVRAPLAAFIEATQANRRPVVFVRGNHETRGAFARPLVDFFAWPKNQPYFAFNAGPIRWVILDCGEDKPDDHSAYSGLVDFTTFRRRETEWLRKEIVSPAFLQARWRVLVHHIPLYSARTSGGFHAACKELWADLLAGAGFDLAINAHTHRPAFHPANSVGNPYPIAVGGGPEIDKAVVMILTADREQLALRMLNAEGNLVFPPFTKSHMEPGR